MLILAATPIGNLSDSSQRLIEHLSSAKYIAAEDTRTVLKLAQGLGIKLNAKLFSLHEHNEGERAKALLAIAETEDVLVVSDAGMPTISDPGFVLVRLAVESGIAVTVIPGPSAVLSALAISGLPTDRFSFEGFIPRKAGDRERFFKALAGDSRTLIFFESPHRIKDSLEAAATVFGPNRRASISRELTKKFEETIRGTLSELIAWAGEEPKGELVLCIAGNTEKETANLDELIQIVEALKLSGKSLKESVSIVATLASVSKSELYDQTIAARGQ